jgi:hypothetical protein
LTESPRTVVLLIDYDNLQICYSRDAPGTQLDLGAVMSLAQTYGRVIVARAYAEWNLLSERLQVYKVGMEPAFAPVMRPEGSIREGKSLADTVMVADGVDLLWTHQPDVLVLVTSDKDMIPLARLAKQRGTLLVVLGSDLTAVPLIEMANDFVTYRHLVRELGRSDEQLPSGRPREEARFRRLHEPAGHREVAAAREASLREPRTIPPRRPRGEPLNRPAFNPRASTPAPSVSPAPTMPVPPAAVPEAVSFAVSALADRPFGSANAQVDESLQALGPRRRRRRGGRGRRGPLGESLAEPSGDSFEEAEVQEKLEREPVRDVEVAPPLDQPEPAPAASYEALPSMRAEAPADEPPAGLLELPPGPRGLRRRRRVPRPETLAAIEPVAEAAPGPVEELTPAESPTLRPWERWPESRPEPTPRRSAARIRLAPSLTEPAPASDAETTNGASMEAAAEPIEAPTDTNPTETVAAAEPTAPNMGAEQAGAPATAAQGAAATTSTMPEVSVAGDTDAPDPIAEAAAPEIPAAVEAVATPEPVTTSESGGDAATLETEAKPVRPRRRRVRRTPAASDGSEAPADGETQT